MNLNIIWEGLLLGEGDTSYFVIFLGGFIGGVSLFKKNSLFICGVVALGLLLRLFCIFCFLLN